MIEFERFRKKVVEYRRIVGKTQKELAQEMGLHPNILSNKLNLTNHASLTLLEGKKIIQILVEWLAITQVRDVLEMLDLLGLKANAFNSDEWNSYPLSELDATIQTACIQSNTLESFVVNSVTDQFKPLSGNLDSDLQKACSENISSIEVFYGRKTDLTRISSWVTQDKCKLIALLGMAGIGKTSLAIKLIEQIKEVFDVTFWYSLKDEPSFERFLTDCLTSLTAQSQFNFLTGVSNSTNRLLEIMRKVRCLIILDNYETVLQDRITNSCTEYDKYHNLISQIGELSHQSCLLLTSREKPREVALLEGNHTSVRTLQVAGLEVQEGQQLLKSKGLFGEEDSWKELIYSYSGNPLALKLISSSIWELFGGNIDLFLQQEELFFGEVASLLDQQFESLSLQEKEIIYWLLIEQDLVSLANLISPSIAKKDLFSGLDSLLRRSFLERKGVEARFVLPLIIKNYIIYELTEQLCSEIYNGKFSFLAKYDLFQIKTSHYTQTSQPNFLFDSLLKKLNLTYRDIEIVKKRLIELLKQVKDETQAVSGYVVENITNLFYQIDVSNELVPAITQDGYIQDDQIKSDWKNFSMKKYSTEDPFNLNNQETYLQDWN